MDIAIFTKIVRFFPEGGRSGRRRPGINKFLRKPLNGYGQFRRQPQSLEEGRHTLLYGIICYIQSNHVEGKLQQFQMRAALPTECKRLDACWNITHNRGMLPNLGLAHRQYTNGITLPGYRDSNLPVSGRLVTKGQLCFPTWKINVFIDDLRLVCCNHHPLAVLTSDVGDIFFNDAVSLMGHPPVG